jgi:hypothetical protein
MCDVNNEASMKAHYISIVLLLTLITQTGCKQESCITPALEREKITSTRVIEAAATLEKLSTSGKLKADFTSELDKNYGKLADKNTELFLFLTAIECYLSHGKVGEEIAKVLAEGVREKYLPKAGETTEISSLERGLIRNGDHAEAILETFKRLGYKVQ